MQSKNIKKITTLCLAGAIVFSLNTTKVNASPYVSDQAVAGISKAITQYYESVSTNIEVSPITGYDNIGIANVNESLNVRKGASENEEKVAILPKDAACEIIEIDENDWAKIKSGKIEGYVKASYLLTGEEAEERAKKVASLVGTVTDAGALRMREEASLLSDTLSLLEEGQEVYVVEVLEEWVHVKTDSKEGYVARQYLDLSYKLKKARSVEELQTGATGRRAEMVSFAKTYLGGRYVWGGTSLASGVDCSGYTQAIYKNFGYSLPRVSRDQANAGTSISSSDARPGDLFFYGNGQQINHVAMYIGNGQVIHASNERTGIKTSNSHYRTPVKVVKYIND